MKAILIYEDNHGLIGLAANYPLAVDFLIKENLLDGSTVILVNNHSCLLKEIFQYQDWQKEIKYWDVETFNKFFDGIFYLEPMEVYGVNYWG